MRLTWAGVDLAVVTPTCEVVGINVVSSVWDLESLRKLHGKVKLVVRHTGLELRSEIWAGDRNVGITGLRQ